MTGIVCNQFPTQYNQYISIPYAIERREFKCYLNIL